MPRGGQSKEREAPERRCIATGVSGDTSPLIRFVVGPDGVATPDLAEKLPGRGMWVTSDRAALELVEKKRLFSRSAKTQVGVPEGLADLVERLLRKRLIEGLSLARKAGCVTAGFTLTDARLRQGSVAGLIEACDGSEKQRAKLRPLAGDAPRVDVLSAAELGVAFGRDHVIHGTLDAGGVTSRVLRDTARLRGVRPLGGAVGNRASEASEKTDGPAQPGLEG